MFALTAALRPPSHDDRLAGGDASDSVSSGIEGGGTEAASDSRNTLVFRWRGYRTSTPVKHEGAAGLDAVGMAIGETHVLLGTLSIWLGPGP